MMKALPRWIAILVPANLRVTCCFTQNPDIILKTPTALHPHEPRFSTPRGLNNDILLHRNIKRRTRDIYRNISQPLGCRTKASLPVLPETYPHTDSRLRQCIIDVADDAAQSSRTVSETGDLLLS